MREKVSIIEKILDFCLPLSTQPTWEEYFVKENLFVGFGWLEQEAN